MVDTNLKSLWPSTAAATLERPVVWLEDPQLAAASCVPEEGTGAYEQLHAYGVGPMRQERIDRSYFKMDPVERDARIWELRDQLGSAHHSRTPLPA